MKNIVIFASGAGSNAEQIIKYFIGNEEIRVASIFTNNPRAGVIQIASNYGIDFEIFSRSDLLESRVLQKLRDHRPDLIVLAGFLLMMPQDIINAYRERIINIHPALLPKYGGKGMYGMNVHSTVYQNKESETGITIHYVDEHYDNGDIIAQFKTAIDPADSCEAIAEKVRKLEHLHYPKIIEKLLT